MSGIPYLSFSIMWQVHAEARFGQPFCSNLELTECHSRDERTIEINARLIVLHSPII